MDIDPMEPQTGMYEDFLPPMVESAPPPVMPMLQEAPKSKAEADGEAIFKQYVEFMQKEMFRKKRGASSKPFAKQQDFRGIEISDQLRDSTLFHQFERRKDYFHDLAFTRAINQSDSGFTVGSGRNDQRAPVLDA